MKIKKTMLVMIFALLFSYIGSAKAADDCLTSVGAGKGQTGSGGNTSLVCDSYYCGRTFPIKINKKQWNYAIYGVRLTLLNNNSKIQGDVINYWATKEMLEDVKLSKVKKLNSISCREMAAEGSGMWSYKDKGLSKIDESKVTFNEFIKDILTDKKHLNYFLDKQSSTKFKNVSNAASNGIVRIKVEPIFVFRYKAGKYYYYYAGTSWEIFNEIKNIEGAKSFLYDDETWNVIKNYLTSVYQENIPKSWSYKGTTYDSNNNRYWYHFAGDYSGVGYINLSKKCIPEKKTYDKVIKVHKAALGSDDDLNKSFSSFSKYKSKAKFVLQKKEKNGNWKNVDSKTRNSWEENDVYSFNVEVQEDDEDVYRIYETDFDSSKYDVYNKVGRTNEVNGDKDYHKSIYSYNIRIKTSSKKTQNVYYVNKGKSNKTYNLTLKNHRMVDSLYRCFDGSAQLTIEKYVYKNGEYSWQNITPSISKKNNWCSQNNNYMAVTIKNLSLGKYRIREDWIGREYKELNGEYHWYSNSKNLNNIKNMNISEVRFKFNNGKYSEKFQIYTQKDWYAMKSDAYYEFDITKNSTMDVYNLPKKTTVEECEKKLNNIKNIKDKNKRIALLWNLYTEEYPQFNNLVNFKIGTDDISDVTCSTNNFENALEIKSSCKNFDLGYTSSEDNISNIPYYSQLLKNTDVLNDSKILASNIIENYDEDIHNLSCYATYMFNYGGDYDSTSKKIKTDNGFLWNSFPSNKIGDVKVKLRCFGTINTTGSIETIPNPNFISNIKEYIYNSVEGIHVLNTKQKLLLGEKKVLEKNSLINDLQDDGNYVDDLEIDELDIFNDPGEIELDKPEETNQENYSDSEDVEVNINQFNLNTYFVSTNSSYTYDIIYDKLMGTKNISGSVSSDIRYLNYGYGIPIDYKNKPYGSVDFKLILANSSISNILGIGDDGVEATCNYESTLKKIDNYKIRFVDTDNPFVGLYGVRKNGSNWDVCENAKKIVNTYSNISKNDIDKQGDNNYCKYGDINCDGYITELDLNLVKMIQSSSIENDYQKELADLNLDGIVDNLDYKMLINVYNNQNVCYDFDNDDKNSFIKKSMNSKYNSSSTEEPMYSFTLTPNNIKEIRNYNKENIFNSFDLTCDDDKKCVSNFITSLMTGGDDFFSNPVVYSGSSLEGACVNMIWVSTKDDTEMSYSNARYFRTFCDNSNNKNRR